MEIKSKHKMNIKVSVKKDGTLIQDDFDQKWFLEGILLPEIAMTIMLSKILTSMYENELSMSDEFEITLNVKSKV